MKGNGHRQRLAWVILAGSFGVWLGIMLAIPLLGSRLIQTASRPLPLFIQVNQGTVRLEGNQQTAAIFTGDPPIEMEAPANVLTSSGDAATLVVYADNGEQVLGRLQVFGDTLLAVEAAFAPRFQLSTAEQEMNLKLDAGRMRVKLPEGEGRHFSITVATPQGLVYLPQPGNYTVEVNTNETQLVALEGEAVLTANGDDLTIRTDERGMIPLNAAPTGPLSTERNLVQNGDFSDGLNDWDRLSWVVEIADQPEGEIQVVTEFGEPALRFQRVGNGHADAGVRQVINQDVRDFDALRLEISLRILEQSIAVCGSVGSECPLALRVEYEDVNGNDQVWQQGFFANGVPGTNGTPDVCITCAPPRPGHVQITSGQIAFYRGDLLTLLPQHGAPLPGRIKNISLLAAGHTFALDVLDVSLIVEESA
jgi:hypothetical protein